MSFFAPLSDEEKKWLSRFERKLETPAGGRPCTTDFFDPRRLELAESALRRRPDLSYTVFGGYPAAERNALSIFPARFQETLPALGVVGVSWSAGIEGPGHRDLLGAVLSLGLRRDQVGDIITLEEGGAAIIIFADKVDFVCANLDRAGAVPVQCTALSPDTLVAGPGGGKEISGTVAGLRLDALLALGFGLSRSRAALLVKGGLVKINFRQVDSPARQLKVGDQVSLRGRGRLILEAVEGETRKGRLRLKLTRHG